MSDQLQTQIAAIDTSGDSVPASQVKELIESVRGMFGDHFKAESGNDQQMFQEIGQLAKFINSAKKELNQVSSSGLTDKELPGATDQLDAIIKMTEKATGKIMDECERVQSIHQNLRDKLLSLDPPIDPDVMMGVDDLVTDAETSVTHIYEACNFQDVTGQRIQKVVAALQEIERQVLRMVVVFGLSQNDDLDEDTKKELKDDAVTLSGPALEGKGLDQDDIDNLLETLF